MALVSTLVATHNTSNNASTYATGTFSAAIGDFLTVSAGVTGSAQSVATPTLSTGAANWTRHDQSLGTNSSYFWTGVVTATITNGTITIDVTGDAGTGAVVLVYNCPGGAFRQFDANGSTVSGLPTGVFANVLLTTSSYIATVGNLSNPAAMTPPSGWSQDFDDGHALPAEGGHGSHRDQGETGTTITFGSTSATAYQAYFVEIQQISVTETGAATDTQTAANTTAASQTETGAATDTVTAGNSIPVAMSEAGAATDTIDATVAAGATNTITESADAADTVSAVAVYAADIAESGAATDTVATRSIATTYYQTKVADGTSTYWDPAVYYEFSRTQPATDTLTAAIAGLSNQSLNFTTVAGEPGVTDWPPGDFTVTVDIASLGANLSITTVNIFKVLADGASSDSSDNQTVSWTTTGAHSVTFTGKDFPSGLSSDRYGISLTINNSAASSQNIVFNVGAGTDAATGPWAYTLHEVAISETGAAADTITAERTQAADITETGAASDTQTVLATFVAAVTEAGSATDTPTAANTTSAAITESGAANDNITADIPVGGTPTPPFKFVYRRHSRVRGRRAA